MGGSSIPQALKGNESSGQHLTLHAYFGRVRVGCLVASTFRCRGGVLVRVCYVRFEPRFESDSDTVAEQRRLRERWVMPIRPLGGVDPRVRGGFTAAASFPAVSPPIVGRLRSAHKRSGGARLHRRQPVSGGPSLRRRVFRGSGRQRTSGSTSSPRFGAAATMPDVACCRTPRPSPRSPPLRRWLRAGHPKARDGLFGAAARRPLSDFGPRRRGASSSSRLRFGGLAAGSTARARSHAEHQAFGSVTSDVRASIPPHLRAR